MDDMGSVHNMNVFDAKLALQYKYPNSFYVLDGDETAFSLKWLDSTPEPSMAELEIAFAEAIVAPKPIFVSTEEQIAALQDALDTLTLALLELEP